MTERKRSEMETLNHRAAGQVQSCVRQSWKKVPGDSCLQTGVVEQSPLNDATGKQRDLPPKKKAREKGSDTTGALMVEPEGHGFMIVATGLCSYYSRR